MRRFANLLLFGFLMGSISCDDVFEEDISDDAITIVAPLDDTALEGNTVQFRWNPLSGADEYRIQITGEQQFLELDSLVNTNIFEYQMQPGSYQWRVRGENFAYTTPYTFDAGFTLAASLDLTKQQIALNSPANNVYFKITTPSFSWEGISTATSYVFQLLKKENNNETQLFEEANLAATSLELSNTVVTADGEYIWQVQGVNATSNTVFTKRTFFVDRVAPPAPTLTTPTADQSFDVNTDVDFSWTFSDTGELQSAITGTIEISSDENFATITLTDTNTTGEFTANFTTADTYYWRVRGEDLAGNTGVNSTTSSFIIN